MPTTKSSSSKPKKPSNKKSAGKQSMDIGKPGRARPDTSSRPVIVTNKPEVEDPMVSARRTVPKEESFEKDEKLDDNKELNYLSAIETDEEKEQEQKDNLEKYNQPAEEPQKAEDEKAEPVKEEEPEDDEDTILQQASDEISRELEDTSNNILDDRDMHEATGSRGGVKLFLGFVLFVLVVVVCFNLAIDAELIDVGIDPLTDFFGD